MRQIIFRGKRVDNGEWIEGNYEYYHKPEKYIISNPYTGETKGVIPETVGQYTGLTDKNGNKIFEGDIVYNGVFKAQIEFINGHFSPFGGDTFFADECEVIGNIHDNPELIGGNK